MRERIKMLKKVIALRQRKRKRDTTRSGRTAGVITRAQTAREQTARAKRAKREHPPAASSAITETRYADPRYDIAFKKLFADTENHVVVIGFLNSMLGLSEEDSIEAVELLDPNIQPEITGEKQSILDVRVRDRRGKQYIIEMQIGKDKEFERRALFYSGKLYTAQLERGDEYSDLKAVIFIGILDFERFPRDESSQYYYRFRFRDLYSDKELPDLIELIFIELPKFKDEIADEDDTVGLWAHLLKNAPRLTAIPREFRGRPALEQAMQKLEQQNWTEEDRTFYLRQQLSRLKEEGILKTTREEGEEIGEARGLAKGREEGEKIGEARGLAKGRAEKIEMVRGLKQQNISTSVIAAATGLSAEEIASMQSSTTSRR
jgi:predicted transposase/invertase (TIGR01784 family)